MRECVCVYVWVHVCVPACVFVCSFVGVGGASMPLIVCVEYRVCVSAYGELSKRSMERDRDRKRNRERYTEKETKSITTVFFCDCTTVYPALLLTIQARAQATSSLRKNLLTALPNSH